jgi:hypothetical protein
MGKLRDYIAERKGQDTVNQTSEQAKRAHTKQEMRSAEQQTFETGEVIEVVIDPVFFLAEVAPKYVEHGIIESIEEARDYPRGTLLVAMDGDDVGDELIPVVPWCASTVGHIPKVGESVWVSEDGSEYKWWHSRIGGLSAAEDVNFSDKNRKFIFPTGEPEDAKEKKELSKGEGLWTPIRTNIQKRRNKDKTEESLKANDLKQKQETGETTKPLREEDVRRQYVLEPVPRFTPRQGDTFLQGSNNSLIVLGTDRGFSIDSDLANQKYSNANNALKPLSGTIDMVVGRGQAVSDPNGVVATSENVKGKTVDTAPMVATHEDGHNETDKNPVVNGLKDNPIEGDPHFGNDLGRIYLSMDTDVDLNFWPKEKYSPMYLEPSDDNTGPSLAMQTKHVRIYAKEDGEIRIVKQGDETTQAAIIISPTGDITVSGERIVLGRKDEHGEADIEEKWEPYVRYSKLHEYMDEFHSMLDSFASQLEKNRSPGHFATDVVIAAAAVKLKADQKVLQEKFKDIQSKRIFGE